MCAVDFQHQNVEYYKTRVCVASCTIIVLSFPWGYTVHGVGELVQHITEIRMLFTKHPITFGYNDDLQ